MFRKNVLISIFKVIFCRWKQKVHLEVGKYNEREANFLPMLHLIMLSAKWIKFYLGPFKAHMKKKITTDLVERDQHSEKMSA